jgi:hypothetical protein
LKPKRGSAFDSFEEERPMNTKLTMLAALAAGILVSTSLHVAAQTNSPPGTTATRPAKNPPDQTSLPSASPPATTTQTTGQTNQDPTVKG